MQLDCDISRQVTGKYLVPDYFWLRIVFCHLSAYKCKSKKIVSIKYRKFEKFEERRVKKIVRKKT